MKPIKFIYFDIGGVLNDWSDYFKDATKKFNIPYDEFKKLWLKDDFADDMTRGKITPFDLWKEAIEKFNLINADDFNFLESWIGDHRPRKQVHELVYKLSKKYRIGLLSNLYKGMMPRLIEIGIVPDINYSSIVLSYETGFRKPEKEIYEIATKESGVKPEEILLIDDRKDILEVAKKIGWQTFWFDEEKIKKSVHELSRTLL